MAEGRERSGTSSEGASTKQGSGLLDQLPTDELGEEFRHLLTALVGRVISGASDRVGDLTERLEQIAEGGGPIGAAVGKAGKATAEGKSPLTAALSAGAAGLKSKIGQAFGGGGGKGGGGGGGSMKVTNIVEEIDIGAPVRVVYDQWTQFQDFSKLMKKVEKVDQEDERKLDFKAQILWSHRTWQATIVEQVPDRRIVWRSSGPKGHVDGAVTFHEIGPELTRVLVVLEYYPQGLFERTGNLWRAQGRRARLELKHFRRHVMTKAMLHPDDVEGWRGEIHDSKVVKGDEDARREEDEQDQGDDEYDEDEGEEDEEDEYDEDDEGEDGGEEEEEGEEEDEYDEDEDDEDEGEEDEGDEDEGDEDEGDEDEGDEEDEYDEDEGDEDEDEDDEDEDEEDEEDDEDEDDEEDDEYDEDEYEDEDDEDEGEDADDDDETTDDEGEQEADERPVRSRSRRR